jgi:NDP-sugar pyrophosphorylase family protein
MSQVSGSMLVEAVILVGGTGTRLRSVVNDRPKPMAEVAGRPFLEWLLVALRSQGVQRVVLCTGYLGGVVEDYFGDGKWLNLEISYSRDPVPLGTGGALRYALTQVQTDCFLVLNGDSYCHIDLDRFLSKHVSCRAKVTLWLVPMSNCERYGRVEIGKSGAVLVFHEKSSGKHAGLISAGAYLLEREIIKDIPEGQAVSLEVGFFPTLIGHGLYAIAGDGPFLDIGTPEAFATAEQFFALNVLK